MASIEATMSKAATVKEIIIILIIITIPITFRIMPATITTILLNSYGNNKSKKH